MAVQMTRVMPARSWALMSSMLRWKLRVLMMRGVSQATHSPVYRSNPEACRTKDQ